MIISYITMAVFALMMMSMPIWWLWSCYHVIKCNKKRNCKNRKCSYWQHCDHSRMERKKEELLMRMEMVETYCGADLSECKKKLLDEWD